MPTPSKSKHPPVRQPRPHVIAPIEVPAADPDAGMVARLDNWAERLVIQCDALGVAPAIRAVTAASVLLLPLVAGYPAIQEKLKNVSTAILVALAYVILAGTSTVFQRHRNAAKQRRQASDLERAMDGVSRASWSLGGGIQSLTEALRRDKQRLPEAQCHSVCVSLLARVQEIAAAVLPQDSEIRLRVTLAVPIVTAGVPKDRGAPPADADPDCLRVWCYDRTHGDRHWTTLPLDSPGAAQAYRTGDIAYIQDVRTVRGLVGSRGRLFRSVVAIPVAGRPDGRPLAVVTIDATQPNHFDPALVAARLHPLILPGVQAIGLALEARKEREHYGFGR